MRGSEEEDSAEDFVTAGVEINEDGDGIAEVDYQIMIRWSCALY